MTTKGDIVRYDSERERYGIGSAGQVLQVASSLPTWSTINLADSVLTTQGDVLYEGASALARLGQSTDNFTLATKGAGANPAWQASATSVMSTTGDLLYASSANTLARLAGGTSGDVLTANGAGVAPSYQTPSAGGGGSYVFLEQFTATAASTFTCTLSSPIALADFSRLVGVFRGKYGAGALELQLSNNITQPLTASHYLWSSNVLSSGGATAEHGSGVDHFELVNATTLAGARGFVVFNVIVYQGQGDGSGLPSDMMVDWQWAGERTSSSGGGYTYNNTGSITTMNGFVLTNSLGNNFEAGALLDVYKVLPS
jgi:hypothetical protein